MLTLGNLFLLMVLATIAAWLWHSHGLREHALALVTRHCARLEIELLDGNVAFRRYALLPDARGRRRFARIYDFEFTVTGEQRLSGHIVMFGRHAGRIEVDAHPVPSRPQDQAELPPIDAVFTDDKPAKTASVDNAPADSAGKVVSLEDWRNRQRQQP
jgi:hypothetical protein